MLRNFKFDYDYENDSLLLYNPKEKSKGSIEYDDLVLDMDKHGDIVGIEILNATSLFKTFDVEGIEITKNTLKGLKDCKVDITARSSFFRITLLFLFASEMTYKQTVFAPIVEKVSPALMAKT